jgi:flavin reductase (DIM6/NTAB) family NADH-FMN oxidoreductase RutF
MADMTAGRVPGPTIPPTGRGGVEAAEFRSLMSRFPSGVTVVTTVDADGRPRGLTCSSVCSVTVDPPTLMVGIHGRSSTLSALLDRRAFAVNFLHQHGRGAAEVFASGRPDRFERIVWHPTAGLGLPHLREAAHAIAECTVYDTVPVDDHSMVIGRVVGVELTDGLPLIYGLREYRCWSRAER